MAGLYGLADCDDCAWTNIVRKKITHRRARTPAHRLKELSWWLPHHRESAYDDDLSEQQACHADQCLHRCACESAETHWTAVPCDRDFGTPCAWFYFSQPASRSRWNKGHDVRSVAHCRRLPGDAGESGAVTLFAAGPCNCEVRSRNV